MLVWKFAGKETLPETLTTKGEDLAVNLDIKLAKLAGFESGFHPKSFLDGGGETRRARFVTSGNTVEDDDLHQLGSQFGSGDQVDDFLLHRIASFEIYRTLMYDAATQFGFKASRYSTLLQPAQCQSELHGHKASPSS